MALKFYIVLIALIASSVIAAQSEDEIPYENDNQFPPESNGAIIEGSGAGVIEEPIDNATETEKDNVTEAPPIEEIEAKVRTYSEVVSPSEEEVPSSSCPKSCVCNIEGVSNDFVINCAGLDLTEFPTPLDSRTTTLYFQDNKLTEIPKEISALKNLKVLNANNNLIMEIMSGSISELPELTTLKLANNRLIEYPKDLKNSFGLTQLQELDLGGNDMRTTLSAETFSNFKSLRQLTLATSTSELQQDLCSSLSETLEMICTGSCKSQSYDCAETPETPDEVEDTVLDALPSMLSFSNAFFGGGDPGSSDVITESKSTKQTVTEVTVKSSSDKVESVSDFSLRADINKAAEEILKTNDTVEVSNEETSNHDPQVGAKTIASKSQGVDKSVIGIIVAGMIVVVAGITIKKNWSSIKKRFSSSPRPANERGGGNTNGNVPEAVPLQEKSPV